MDSTRVRALLQAVQDRRDPSGTADERAILVSEGLLGAVDPATRDAWTQRVASLPAVRDRVREESRIALATPGPAAPAGLRAMIADLEELTREKASLDSLVWNGPTQEYLRPTLAGRSALEDLTTWEVRLANRSYEDFEAAMGAYRQGLLQTVARAGIIYHGLLMSEEMSLDEPDYLQAFTTVDLRFASMILAKRSLDPNLLVRAFEFFNHDTNWGTLNPQDRLIGSAILSCLPWEAGVSRGYFERIRIELASHGILPEDRIIVAASLADLDPSWWDPVFNRVDEIRHARPALNSLLVSALARSPYPSGEALSRYDAALAGMATRGYQDGISVQAAAAILASAQIPAPSMVDRFAVAASHLGGAFDPVHPPAAMLAASPLEPNEAVDVFRDCIGTITRTNFFELTLEIEELALIMSYGVAPLGLGYLAANLPPGAAPPRPVLPVAMAPIYGPYWFVWHNYWVYRPIGRYIATHPVHVHTVAAFG